MPVSHTVSNCKTAYPCTCHHQSPPPQSRLMPSSKDATSPTLPQPSSDCTKSSSAIHSLPPSRRSVRRVQSPSMKEPTLSRPAERSDDDDDDSPAVAPEGLTVTQLPKKCAFGHSRAPPRVMIPTLCADARGHLLPSSSSGSRSSPTPPPTMVALFRAAAAAAAFFFCVSSDSCLGSKGPGEDLRPLDVFGC